ncbi:MAG TPA: DUF2062 domain-containing protein [Chthoniobacterales bacterium]
MTPTGWLRAKGKEFLNLKDTPHALALGMAIGIFFGLIPLWGVKTLLALGIARWLHGNLVAATVGVSLPDIILPLVPLLLRWEYDLGYWLLSHPHELPPSLHLAHYHPSVWFHWSTFLTVGRPLLVGSVAVAVPAAIVTYYVTRTLVNRWKLRRLSSRGV